MYFYILLRNLVKLSFDSAKFTSQGIMSEFNLFVGISIFDGTEMLPFQSLNVNFLIEKL